MDLGLACHVCGTLNAMSAQTCGRCGTVLSPTSAPQPPPASAHAVVDHVAPSGEGSPGAQAAPPSIPASQTQPGNGQVPADQAAQHRFDPTTGQPLPGFGGEPPAAKTLFFGALQQQPVVPRLVVIKGEGGDGATYHLQGTTTIVGRNTGEITFVEDPFLSPEHAKFTSQTGRLFVQDMGSENGVFLRIKKPTPIKHTTTILVGEQVLRLERRPIAESAPNSNGTYYYGSPRPSGVFQVVQCLAGGGEGLIATSEEASLSMGREGNTLNFPNDRFISGHHARLDAASDSDEVILTDTGSRNGTFVRLNGAQELFHGDYLFVGQQLLRVEIA